jgi:hypothetical protein
MDVDHVRAQAIEQCSRLGRARIAGLHERDSVRQRVLGGRHLGRTKPCPADDGHSIPYPGLGSAETAHHRDRAAAIEVHVVDDVDDVHSLTEPFARGRAPLG